MVHRRLLGIAAGICLTPLTATAQMPDDVAIWGVEAEQTDEFGEDLSPAVEAAVAGVVSQVKEYVNTNAELIGAAT